MARGEFAVAEILRLRPDVVLLDLMLPGLRESVRSPSEVQIRLVEQLRVRVEAQRGGDRVAHGGSK